MRPVGRSRLNLRWPTPVLPSTTVNTLARSHCHGIELGTLIEADPLPARLQEHLELLIKDGALN